MKYILIYSFEKELIHQLHNFKYYEQIKETVILNSKESYLRLLEELIHANLKNFDFSVYEATQII